MRREKGITLIALVITIIILIILASVSIAMLTGENGILDKAKEGKIKAEIADLIERTRVDILKLETINDREITKGEFIDVLKNYFKEETVPSEDDLPDDISSATQSVTAKKEYGSYNIKISDIWNGKFGISNEENKVPEKGITAKQIAENPEEYYGKTVTNYESQNGQKDWKIFYSNGTNIFLITGDYIENNKIDTEKTGLKPDGTCTYRVYWGVPPSMQDVSEETKTLFMTTGYALNSNDTSSKCASTLLNTNNWESFKDNEGKAKSCIGGPTIEMWMASWNNVYPNDKLYCDNTSEYGYYVGTNSNPTSSSLTYTAMNKKAGYQNQLYYPYTTAVSDGSNNCECYLTASPTRTSSNIFAVSYNGSISGKTYSTKTKCIRPVVCLNSDVTVEGPDLGTSDEGDKATAEEVLLTNPEGTNDYEKSPYVKYNNILCRVLYNDKTHGLQIISAESVENVTLQLNDFNIAKETYNNLVDKLNNKAKEHMNKDGIVIDARCLGSLPTLKDGIFQGDTTKLNYTNSYNSFSQYNNQFKPAYNYSEEDVNQLNDLGLYSTDAVWLAVRIIDTIDGSINNGHTLFHAMAISGSGGTPFGSNLCYVESNGVGYAGNSYGTYGFRPIFLLSSDVKIISGDGKSADTAYVLGQ